jgi:hypothetical protein
MTVNVDASSGRQPAHRFGRAALAGLNEPVRRHLSHAITDGAAIPTAVRLTMAGRINVGRWLAFSAEQEFVGHSFAWRARAGWGPFKPLHVVDAFRDARGSMDGRLFGRLRFLHADDENTARAAAARAAAESIWVPGMLLPDRGVAWRTESDDCIVASFAVPPEHPEVVLRIDETGAVRSVSVRRWGNVGQQDYGYMPFGGQIHAERRFGDVVVPSAVTVGWWFGTPRFKPFFEATIQDVAVMPACGQPSSV